MNLESPQDYVTRRVSDEIAAKDLRRAGPVLDVDLEFECNRPPCPKRRGKALVDTGASGTAIEFDLTEDVEPNGNFMAQGVTSKLQSFPTYPVHMTFPGSKLPQVDVGRAIGSPHLKSQGIVALIGRDVLEQAHLTYDGPGGEFVLEAEGETLAVKPSGAKFATAFVVALSASVLAYLLLKKPCTCTTGAPDGSETPVGSETSDGSEPPVG